MGKLPRQVILQESFLTSIFYLYETNLTLFSFLSSQIRSYFLILIGSSSTVITAVTIPTWNFFICYFKANQDYFWWTYQLVNNMNYTCPVPDIRVSLSL